MGILFEELDYQGTSIGGLSLRRRQIPQVPGVDLYEVKLGSYFLMSSLFHEAEYQLSKLALKEVEGDQLEVVVGGLGLGYTAVSALEDPRVASLHVIEYLEPVIGWHRRSLVPLGETLCQDSRCSLVHADFFENCRNLSRGFHPEREGAKFDAVLLDIDHTPTHVLTQTNTRFYTQTGLEELKHHLKPGGVFGLWSDGVPEEAFIRQLSDVFESVQGHTVSFENPITEGESTGAVYVCR